ATLLGALPSSSPTSRPAQRRATAPVSSNSPEARTARVTSPPVQPLTPATHTRIATPRPPRTCSRSTDATHQVTEPIFPRQKGLDPISREEGVVAGYDRVPGHCQAITHPSSC